MEKILSALARGRGEFAREFTLDDQKPTVRFSLNRRDDVLGPRRRYHLAAGYYDKSRGTVHYDLGDLIPTDDAGGYQLTAGEKTFSVVFAEERPGSVFVTTEEV